MSRRGARLLVQFENNRLHVPERNRLSAPARWQVAPALDGGERGLVQARITAGTPKIDLAHRAIGKNVNIE